MDYILRWMVTNSKVCCRFSGNDDIIHFSWGDKLTHLYSLATNLSLLELIPHDQRVNVEGVSKKKKYINIIIITDPRYSHVSNYQRQKLHHFSTFKISFRINVLELRFPFWITPDRRSCENCTVSLLSLVVRRKNSRNIIFKLVKIKSMPPDTCGSMTRHVDSLCQYFKMSFGYTYMYLLWNPFRKVCIKFHRNYFSWDNTSITLCILHNWINDINYTNK